VLSLHKSFLSYLYILKSVLVAAALLALAFISRGETEGEKRYLGEIRGVFA
jgi:hypothetical protein